MLVLSREVFITSIKTDYDGAHMHYKSGMDIFSVTFKQNSFHKYDNKVAFLVM